MDEAVFVRQSSFSSLVFAVKDVCVVGQTLVVLNVLVQANLILTWREGGWGGGGKERREEKNRKRREIKKDEKGKMIEDGGSR